MTSDSATKSQVLIVGAGPTGLALALWLARLGVRIRVVDKTADVAPISRALGVHARTLEFYRQLGFAEAVVNAGVIVPSVNMWVRGRRVSSVPFASVGEGLTPFPFVLDFAQDEHERLLIARLREGAVTVERNTELTAFRADEQGVEAVLRTPDGGEEHCRCDYLCGCDGAHSTVRELLNIEFAGGTYDHLFYVADVVARGPAVGNGIHVDLDEADLLAIFDMKGNGHVRLVGTLPPEVVERRHEAALTFDDVAQRPIEQLHLEIERVNWFSTYRVHHRVANRFHVGRVFLLGDAAHVHSPVGAQGMNTGIGDAVNLAWKLAAVSKGEMPESVLDTYESERIAFARRLVRTTDRAFAFASQSGRIAALVRTRLFPGAVTALFRFRAMRRFLFRTVSQIEIKYRHSKLSRGRAGAIHGGDRLPWFDDNFRPLTSLRWQVHVYGDASDALRERCRELGLALSVFAWQPAMQRAGFHRDALYLLRPDGYVAFADGSDTSGKGLATYVAALHI
ncbi:MAG: FAD-dependent monooxygenase [Gemmatimonadaceae bacterium]